MKDIKSKKIEVILHHLTFPDGGGFVEEKDRLVPSEAIDALTQLVEETVEEALDRQRIQHSRTMAILIKDHKKEIEKAYQRGWYAGIPKLTKAEVKKLFDETNYKAKKTK